MTEYQDFITYSLQNDGAYSELDIKEEELSESLHPEQVLLIIRQDLRRLWIWKGPKSPVRKRFISSRAASEIQEQLRKSSGRHLKIVSVDAGDEPIEFLTTFNLESMEVKEKLEDMKYIRNAERDLLRQKQIKKTMEERKKKQEYWSPLMDEIKDEKNLNAIETLANENKINPSTLEKNPINNFDNGSNHAYFEKKSNSNDLQSLNSQHSHLKENENEILEEVLKNNPPETLSRMNIIIGKTLYAPSIKQSLVLGKTIEEEEWNAVKDLPVGIIDLEMKKLRVFIDKKSKYIKAIELYQESNSKSKKVPEKSIEKSKEKQGKKNPDNNSKPNSQKKSTGKKPKRALPKIPKDDK